MHLLLRISGVIGLALLLLIAVGFLGLQIRPRPFAGYPEGTPALRTLPLPDGLPAPVARYYRAAVGESVPVVESAVISGSAHVRLGGLRFPARWRFTHEAGQGYRHYIEVTLFGYPLFKVNEHYLDGRARLALPGGVIENDPKTDMAANLGLWGESLFLPTIFLTDPRVRWEPIDETQARLVVPFFETEDHLTVTFDPETGLIRQMEAMRWKEPTSATKTLWRLEPHAWERLNGVLVPSAFTATWADDPGPWLVATTTEIVYNVDVRDYIRAVGP